MKTYIKLSCTVIMMSFLFSIGCSTSSVYKTFEEQVEETISSMITLLEQGNYYDLVRDYADPEFVNEKGGVEAVTRNFSEDDKIELFKYLKVAQEMLPLIDRAKLTATFTSAELPRDIVFQKKSGSWYLLNE